MTQGIKISKPTKDVKTVVLEDLLFHSDYAMFKYHLDTTADMTINAGDTTKLITIPHGLSYVPVFMAYVENSGIWKLPTRFGTISGIDVHTYAYADATNIYIGYKSAQPFNQEDYYLSSGLDLWSTEIDYPYYFSVGRVSNNPFDGAFRFPGIYLNNSQTVSSAKLYIYTGEKGGSGNIKFRTWGIDEDNTSDFSSGPMSRPKTDAVTSTTRTVPTNIGDTIEVDVVNQVNEIVTRSGWSSGNALGFIINENSGDPDAWMGDHGQSFLRILKPGSISYSFRIIVFKDKIHS